MHQPSILHCHRLGVLPVDTWAGIRQVFAAAETCRLQQAWLPAHVPEFRPASVRLGYTTDALCVYAILEDADIFNPVTEFNVPAFLHGDVFEIFLRPTTQEAYYEFHISPADQLFQLRIPAAGVVRLRPFTEFLFEPRRITSQVQLKTDEWQVLAAIPLDLVQESGAVEPGTRWRFSFCRYDYTRGKKQPVLSSTSPHQLPDFHRQQEWGELIFV